MGEPVITVDFSKRCTDPNCAACAPQRSHMADDDRKTTMGSTDVAPAFGLSPYQSEAELWLQKMGRLPPQEVNPPMYWGTRLEAIIAEEYATRQGVELLPGPTKIIEGWMRSTPDRLIKGEPHRLLEVKTASIFDAKRWGEEGTDQIPVEHLVQVIWHMLVHDADVTDVAVLLGGQDFRIYTVHADADAEYRVSTRARMWWETHILGKVPPLPRGDQGTRAMLQSLFPKQLSETILAADERISEMAHRLELARGDLAVAEEDKLKAENELKSVIGDALGVAGEGFRITWKATKPSVKVNWENVARGLLKGVGKDVGDAIVSLNTTEAPGIRRFLAKFGDDDE